MSRGLVAGYAIGGLSTAWTVGCAQECDKGLYSRG